MTTPNDAPRVVTFRVGRDLYAVDIALVERVLRHEPARAVPEMPEWVDGVIDFQARVVPVIDLRKRFGCPEALEQPTTRVVVLRVGDESVGVVVDAVLDVRPAPPDDISPPPALLRGISGSYLRGMWRRDPLTVVVVLDAERLLAERGPLAGTPSVRA